MPASDALYQQAQLRQELSSLTYTLFMEAMVPSMQQPDVGPALLPSWWTPDKVRADMRLWLDAAETYYVSPDMMRLAIGASESLPDDATVERQAPMSTQGFMWLASPLRIIDVRGRVLAVNALLWSVIADGVMVWLYADKYDPINAEWGRVNGYGSAAELPRLTPWHGFSLRFGEPLPMSLQLRGQRPIPPEVRVEVIEHPNGEIAWAIGDGGMSAEDMVPEYRPATEAQFLTVVWRLMRQTIVDLHDEQVDKRTRRLAQKHLRGDRHVTVIALRHKESRREGDRTWSLDHRILVRGHWRHQWYGSGDDRWQDWVYIHPFVKGPEGAPLVITDKVNALLR